MVFFNTISGWGFSLSSPVVLTNLGVFDLDSAGLDSPHIVTVWTSTGTQLVQTTVPVGTSSTLIDGFRYVAVPPTLLPAGDYIIGAAFPDNNLDRVMYRTTATTASGVTYNGTYFGFVGWCLASTGSTAGWYIKRRLFRTQLSIYHAASIRCASAATDQR